MKKAFRPEKMRLKNRNLEGQFLCCSISHTNNYVDFQFQLRKHLLIIVGCVRILTHI